MAAINDTDIEYRLTGGANNSNQASSLGGVVSTTKITSGTPGQVFTDVSGTQAEDGHTAHRGIAVFNNNGSNLTFNEAKVFIETVSSSSDVVYSIARTGRGADTALEVINDETADPGVTFSRPTDYSNGIDLGDISAGDYYGIWIKRVVASQASATDRFSVTITTRGSANE